MGDAHTRPLGAQQKAQTLALADLRTVKWVASQTLVKEAYNVGKPRYLALKQAAIVGWVVVFYEMVLVWWWTFAHNLPWPAPVLAGLTQLDLMVVRLLDFTQQRLEWWWDAWGVRLMWIRETLLARLDRYITIIDRYLLRVQDVLAAILTLLITPLSIVFEYLNVTPKVVQKPGRANDDQGQGRAVGGAHDDDGDEDEEWGDDNLSDASTDSKLLLKNDPQGQSYNRLHTTIMAEGRLREAMYHRVKKELHLMRKNSIRFSYGIVTYARRMVPPRMYPYGESFLAYCQKWARELELWELAAPVQEAWSSDKHFLGKVLALARALCVAYLAFLLRLAKGKKSRRTRSMRSESFRRRTQNLTCGNSSLPLSPSALQQSSEPTPSHPLGVVPPAGLQEAAPKEDEDSDDSHPENNVLISKENPTSRADADRTILPIDEEEESDEDSKGKKDPDHDISEDSIASLDEGGKDSGFSDKRSEDEDHGGLPERPPLKKEVTIAAESSPPLHKHKFKFNRGKKNLSATY
nr:uncharacterized protein LOC123772230 [Procambarus clarkii]